MVLLCFQVRNDAGGSDENSGDGERWLGSEYAFREDFTNGFYFGYERKKSKN